MTIARAGLRRWSASAVLARFREFASAILAGRTFSYEEAVHQVRVAARRLRSVLSLLATRLPSEGRDARRALKAFAGAVGEVRDLDNQLAFIRRFARLRPARRRALAPFLRSLAGRRADARRAAGVALGQLAATGSFSRLGRALAEASGGAEAAPLSGKGRRRAARRLSSLLSKALRRTRGLDDPEDVWAHHAARIAFKRLRYALDLFEPAFGKSLRPSIRAAKDMQQSLGDLHDCDVWRERLPAARRIEGKPDPARRRVFEDLDERLRLLRRVLYRRACRRRDGIARARTWKRLRRFLSAG